MRMKFINAQQLAFVLDIKKEDARAKMCVAWSKSKNIENTAHYDKNGKLKDDYPLAMDIEMLSKELNLPTLQEMVNDIESNYLNRPATRKWILCDYPEKQIKKCEDAGKPHKVSIPPALKSMLSISDVELIKSEWRNRYKRVIV
jgi:hypothetical protein